MDYTDITNEWANLTAIPATDTYFQSNLPTTIAYVEQLLTRDLDLMAANITDATSSTTANSRTFTLPTTYGTFQIITSMNVITPASTAPDSGTRNPLTPVSQDVLDFTYGDVTSAGVPQEYAWITQDTTTANQPQVILGPWPDNTYRIEVVGKVQPTALSATNPTTWLSVNLPALYITAGMIQLSGYMKNYSASADDPQQPGYWSKEYQRLLAGAGTWQARARFGGPSWTSRTPEPISAPQRG